MFGIHRFARRLGAMAMAVGLAMTSVPLAAWAQDQDQDVPSYAQPAYASADETIHGRIRSVEGAFTISVDDDRGFVDSVQLHQGTIINPTGLTLSPGMSVTILGANAGSVFSANEIDTPYTYDGPLPTPIYYGPGYWCPGFAYGYGPSFSLAIVIGGGPRPWYYEHRPYFGRPWNGRGYFGASIAFAPQDHGLANGRRTSTEPTVRAPSAFAGRSFAGESRIEPDRFDTQSTARPSVTRTTTDMRGPAPEARSNPSYTRASSSGNLYSRGEVYSRGDQVYSRGDVYSRGSASMGGGYSRGPAPRGGSATTARGGGSSAHSGGGHAH